MFPIFFTKVINNCFFRDSLRNYAAYEPIALVEHQGQMSSDGETEGHYICDLQDKESLTWFRTNDNQTPIAISLDCVTQTPVVVLYKKINIL